MTLLSAWQLLDSFHHLAYSPPLATQPQLTLLSFSTPATDGTTSYRGVSTLLRHSGVQCGTPLLQKSLMMGLEKDLLRNPQLAAGSAMANGEPCNVSLLAKEAKCGHVTMA